MPNYSYEDVLNRWDQAQQSGETRSLPDYAKHLNDIYDTQDYAAGLRDGPWTRASTRADQFLRGSVGQVTGAVGGAVGGLFGQEEAGERVGQNLPRALLETAPLYLLGPEAGAPATAAALGLTGGLMGAHTYAETGSAKAALISGATGAALPALGELGGGLASRLASASKVSGEWLPEYLRDGMNPVFNATLPETAADVSRVETGRFLGSQLAQFAGNEASMYAMHNTLNPNEPFDPLSADFLLQQIPFTVHDAISRYNRPKLTAEDVRPMLQQPGENQPPTPAYVPPSKPDQQATLQESMANMEAVFNNVASTQEEKDAALDAFTKTTLNPEGVEKVKAAVVQQPTPESQNPVGEWEGGEMEAHSGPELQGPTELRPEEQQSLVQMGVPPQRVLQLVDTQQKSGNIALDSFQGPIQKDVEGNVVRLGNTDIAKDGWVDETRFQKATQLPEGFVEAMRQQYPEAFQNGQVNATALVKGLQERPMLEVKELGEGANTTPEARRFAELQHIVDSHPEKAKINQFLTYGDDRVFNELSPEAQQIAKEYDQLNNKNLVGDSPDAKYSFLGPKSEQDMPGYVEGLVRVPSGRDLNDKLFEQPSKVQFSGPHFGAEDTNVLAFYRGYEETLPDGSKAFHVIEVQSDWAQKEREQSKAYVGLEHVSGHPLLPFYETLALKAAIQHAQKVGALSIILSDAETAMMTEGHDRTGTGGTYNTRAAALEHTKLGGLSEDSIIQTGPETWSLRPSQDAGMRLHYDATLPDTLAKLTGEPGQEVGLGEHKSARDRLETTPDSNIELETGQPKLQGSPVFRDSSGAPKTQITGRLFPLDRIAGGLSANDTLSLKEAVAKYNEAKQKETVARFQGQQVFSDAKQIAAVFGEDSQTSRESIDSRISAGASAAQAVVHEVMRKLGMDVHEAQVEQEVQKAETNSILDPTQYPKQQLAIHDLIRDRALWGKQQELKTDTKGEFQNKYGDGLKDEKGAQMLWASRLEAEQYRDSVYRPSHVEDKQPYVARQNGQGRFYLAPVINKGTSLDKPIGSGVMTKQDVLADYTNEERQSATEAAAKDLISRPEASVDVYLRNLDVASRSPQVFQREGDFDDLPSAIRAIRQARVVLSKNMDKTFADLNAELEKSGVPKFESKQEYTEVMAKVRDGLEAFDAKFTQPTLGSEVPFDQKLVATIGVSRGPKAVVSWIAQQKFGLLSEFAKAFARHPQLLDQASFVLPGEANWNPTQTFYQPNLGGGEINLHFLPSAENAGSWVRNVMHEVLHHFEDQLAGRTDPAALQYKQIRSDILDVLRQSSELPKRIKNYLQKTIVRGDVDKWAEGKIDYSDVWKKELGLKDYNDYHGILYGLQNPDEMVAQLFSDKDMQALAFLTQVPKTKGIWDSVVHWFSEVLGKFAGLPNNAMTEILKGFDNYLTGGILKNSYNGADYIRDSLVSKYGVQPEALASRMQSIEQMYSKGDLRSSIAGFQREMENGMLNPNQAQGQLVQSLRTSLVSGEPAKVYHGTKNLLAAEVPVHQELWYRMKQDYDLVKDLHDKVSNSELPGSVADGMKANLAVSARRLGAMQQALEKQALAIDRWQTLDQFDREGYEEAVIGSMAGRKFAAPSDPTGLESLARGAMGLADEEPELARVKRESSLAELQQGTGAKVGDWLRRTFMFTQFLKRQIPEFRLAADHVSNEQAQAFVRMRTLDAAYAFDPQSGKPSDDVIENNRRVATTPQLFKAASEIKLWQQEQDRAKVESKLSDPFPQSVLARLSPKDREAVIQEANSAKGRHTIYTEQTVPEFLSRFNQEQTSKVIVARETGMKPTQGRQLSEQMYNALGGLSNPETQLQSMEALRILSTQMQPETYLRALQLSQGLVQDSNDQIAFMRSRSNYVTEQRLQRYHMRMTGPDGKPFYTDADSQQELDSRRKNLEKQGYKFVYFVPKAEANAGSGLDPDLLGKLQELDTQAYNRVAAALQDKPEIAAQVLPETQRANDYAQSLAALTPVPGAGGPQRKFVAGREFINMVQNDNQFYIRANNWMRHKLVRATTDVDMLDPAVLGNRQVKELVQQHVQNNLSPDNPTARKLNEATYFTKLAWNFGVNFLHGIQSLTTGMAAAISETGSVGDALQLTLNAQKAITQRALTKKWANPEHEWLIDRATEEGAKGLASWSDIFDPERATIYDASNPTSLPGKALNTAKWAARSWTGMFMSFNDQVGLLAGYDLARSRGLSQEDAYSQAKDFKERGYYTGGKAQRGVGLWSIQSKAVPQLLSSLQSYTFGWFSQLTDNYINGFGDAPKGLTPTQRLGAKKAFLYQLGAQAVLAGALGLPGVGQGMALMKQATGTDVKGWVQQNLASMFDEDQTNGGLVSSLALHGAMASFTPVDPSMRHMPSFPFIGVSPYKGFDISTLAPAPISSAADVVQGLLAAAKGDVETLAQKTLPHVLQGPYKLWQGEGDIRDKRGTLLYQLSPTERFVVGLGMNPTRVERARDTAEAVKALQEKQEAMLGSLADDVATTQRTQGVDASRAKLRDIVAQNPGVDPVKLATAAVARLVAQTVPYQPQRSVNPALDLTGLTSQTGPQETQRSQIQQQGRAAFGLQWRNNLSREEDARQTDAVLQSNPYLPVSTARKVASGKVQAPRPYSGLSILGTQ